MGITIHYNGRFNPEASLKNMIEEVKDIAETFEWEYFIFEQDFPEETKDAKVDQENIYGITISIPECESLDLCFLSNKRMSSAALLQFYGESSNPKYKEYLYMPSVKTQFAGAESHKFVIHLLKHLNTKYFLDFNVFDEGKYWGTEDEKILEETFALYTNIIDSFSTAISTTKKEKGESYETYFTRLMNMISKRLDKN